MTIDASDIALSAVNECMRDAIRKVTDGLERCGKLDHPEMKLSEEARAYFRQQVSEQKKALIILQGIHRELNNRLWADTKQPSVQEGK